MSKQFCSNCGAEIIGGSFCSACGKAVVPRQPPVQPAAAQEQNSAQEQPYPRLPYESYSVGAVPQYTSVPAQKKPLNKNLLIGICAGAAVVAIAVVLMIVFAGGSAAGDILKNYRYRDIVGDYEGVLTVERIRVGGDYDELARYAGFYDRETVEEFNGEEMDCEISLDDDDLTIWAEEGIFFSSSYAYIEDIKFVKGRAKGRTIDEEEDAGTMTVTYDLTLHEGSLKDSDYRIYGTIEVKYEVELLKAKCTYICEITVDCEY